MASFRLGTNPKVTSRMRDPMSRVQACGEEMISQHGFLGVPVETLDQRRA